MSVAATAADATASHVAAKLEGPADRLRAAFKAHGGRLGDMQKGVRIFYDTGDRRLWRKGYSLSVGAEGDAYRLTLRQESGLGLVRPEWSAPVATPTPDPGLLPSDAPTAPFGDILSGELLPRFRVVADSAAADAHMDDAAVELTLRRGGVVAIAGEARFYELEVCLADGDLAGFLAAARDIAGAHKLGLSLTSKVEHGMAVAAGARLGPAKGAWPVFTPDVTVGDAVEQILAVAARHITRNLGPAAEASDIGGVHQARVALRRLRSAFSLFKGELGPLATELNDGARMALRALGTARDLDVFLAETAPPVIAELEGKVDFAPLIARAERARANAYADVRRMLRGPEFAAFLTDLFAAAEAGALDVTAPDRRLKPMAARLLRKRLRRTLKAGDGFAFLPNETRHEARIALKKVRYACGYFQSLFDGEDVYIYRKRMSALQDDLGRLNDADVAAALVDRLAAGDRAAAVAGAAIKGWQACRVQASEDHMVAAWQAFAEARPFWK